MTMRGYFSPLKITVASNEVFNASTNATASLHSTELKTSYLVFEVVSSDVMVSEFKEPWEHEGLSVQSWVNILHNMEHVFVQLPLQICQSFLCTRAMLVVSYNCYHILAEFGGRRSTWHHIGDRQLLSVHETRLAGAMVVSLQPLGYCGRCPLQRTLRSRLVSPSQCIVAPMTWQCSQPWDSLAYAVCSKSTFSSRTSP